MKSLKEDLDRIKTILKYEVGKTITEQEGSDPRNPNAYPDQDEFGMDDSWSWDEWKIYYDSLQKQFGAQKANSTFLKYWEVVEQGTFVKADNDMEPEWFKSKGIWNVSTNKPYTSVEYQTKNPQQKKVSQKPIGVSDKLVEFIKKEEFFVPCVYDDKNSVSCLRGEMNKCCLRGKKSLGVPTIGFGTNFYPNGVKVKPKDQDINKEKATEYLKGELDKIASQLIKIYPKLNQNQLDAVSSLCYNVGLSGCTKKAPKLSKALKVNPNSKSNKSIALNFLDFQNRNRREKEFMIYDEGRYV